MKEVLFYGDSYVYGKIPGGDRYSRDQRFTSVIQTNLGSEFKIIEEGLRGRMLFGENKFFPERDGYAQFGPIIGSHLPVDLIVFVLGANDCNSGNTLTPNEIASKYALYQNKLNNWCDFLKCAIPSVLVVTPPTLDEQSAQKAFGTIFEGSTAKSQLLQEAIETEVKSLGWLVMSSSLHVSVSEIDGIHLSIEDNTTLANVIAKQIRTIIG